MELPLSARGSGVLALIVADIANPVFVGMIRGAERETSQRGLTLAVVETQESPESEQRAITRLEGTADGFVLASSRLSDTAIRALAKRKPVVVLNRTVGEVTSVVSDNVQAIMKATEHLTAFGHSSICYLSGPEASYANGMRWRGLKEAGLELDIPVRRIGPYLPTMRGGADAAAAWTERPTSAVIAYNDLMAIGFMQAVAASGRQIPGQVSVVGFDNIVDADLIEPGLTTIAAPLVSIGATAVGLLLHRTGPGAAEHREAVLLPARLVVRGSTAPRQR
jgi:LacI family transcriptional regulator